MSESKNAKVYPQIHKYQTEKKLVEAIDMIENYGKVKLNLLDYTNGKGEKTITASGNIDLPIAGVVFTRVLNQQFERLPVNKDYISLYSEVKIQGRSGTNEKGEVPVKKLSITFNTNPERKLKYQIKSDNGYGVSETTRTGGTQLKANTYRSESAVTIDLSEIEMQKLAYMVIRRIDYHMMKGFLPSLIGKEEGEA